MKNRTRNRSISHKTDGPIDWLPIDSRLIPFLTFPHVRGITRIFLLIEIGICTLIVCGTLVLTALWMLAK